MASLLAALREERRLRAYLLASIVDDVGVALSTWAGALMMTNLFVDQRARAKFMVPMLCAFLDALGLPHEGGLIDASFDLKPVPAEKLEPATAALYEGYPRLEVDLYLACLKTLDPETWEALPDVALRERTA